MQWKQKNRPTKKEAPRYAKPTSVAIKEQVSKELAEQLPDQASALVVESALKTGSKTKTKKENKV